MDLPQPTVHINRRGSINIQLQSPLSPVVQRLHINPQSQATSPLSPTRTTPIGAYTPLSPSQNNVASSIYNNTPVYDTFTIPSPSQSSTQHASPSNVNQINATGNDVAVPITHEAQSHYVKLLETENISLSERSLQLERRVRTLAREESLLRAHLSEQKIQHQTILSQTNRIEMENNQLKQQTTTEMLQRTPILQESELLRSTIHDMKIERNDIGLAFRKLNQGEIREGCDL